MLIREEEVHIYIVLYVPFLATTIEVRGGLLNIQMFRLGTSNLGFTAVPLGRRVQDEYKSRIRMQSLKS